MALDLSALKQYVDELSQPIISKAILEANTAKYIDIFQGVKYAEAIQILDNNPFSVIANNTANMGFTDSGTTTMTEIAAVACPLKINKSFQLVGTGGLEMVWYGQLMKAGANQEDAPKFEEAFLSLLAKQTSQAVDFVTWLGSYNPLAITYAATSGSTGVTNSFQHSADTAGNTGYLSTCQGILYNLLNVAASSGSTIVTYSGAPTVSTVYAIIEAIVGAIPSNMLGLQNISIWCQPAYVDMYKRALIANNNFHYFVQGSEATSDLNIQIPGRSNIHLRGTIGLAGASGNGYQGFITSNDDNLVLITDLLNDYEKAIVWWSDDFEQLRTTVKFKAGGQVKLGQQPATQVIIY